ncbi:MAG: sulfide/dihydroorotate dehydrogenase-like FAD/NAD-binding protein [Bacteroidales bacterium]|nr:sulfide/dihydroorotate dehydrogenase-like FAD/NAD-binding protein [Bacteroidales bacterium]
MYKILTKDILAPGIFRMDILAPRVAASAKPGQFVIVRMDEKGERIPLTICDYDVEKGSVTIVVQVIGGSTLKMSQLEPGDTLADFVGPLGQPSEMLSEKFEDLAAKKIIFLAGGLGTAPVYPQVKWLHHQGIKADVMIAAKSSGLLIMVEEMKKVAGNVYIATDDGSEGFHGMITDCLQNLIDRQGGSYDLAIVIGPMIMMKFAALLTQKLSIPTIVSLNTLMVDGTGMCGACRVTVGGKTKFACVDGPEFDGALVDFDEALRRQTMYKGYEGKKLYEEQCALGIETCKCPK